MLGVLCIKVETRSFISVLYGLIATYLFVGVWVISILLFRSRDASLIFV